MTNLRKLYVTTTRGVKYIDGRADISEDIIDFHQAHAEFHEMIRNARKIAPTVKFIFKNEMEPSPHVWGNGELIECAVIYAEFETKEELVAYNLTHTHEALREIWIG